MINMSKIITKTIRVEIKDINVDEFYFDFKYRILINDRIHSDWEKYEDDHSWGHDRATFKKMLEGDYALQLALEQIDFDDES